MQAENPNNAVATEEVQPRQEPAAKPADQPEITIPKPESSERDRLLKEKAEIQDLLQRRQAEFENYRRRVERERGELLEFASMDTVKSLLPVLDDFERGLKMEGGGKEYSRGMELIYQRLYESLKKLGLEPI